VDIAQPLQLINVLAVINLFLSSANVIVAFSLLVYVVAHNPRHPVSLSFCVLMTFITLVYVGDITHISIEVSPATSLWMAVEWAGLVMIPPAYLHFSHTLLRTTGIATPVRRRWRITAYLISLLFFLVGVTTETISTGIVVVPWGTHFRPGVLYPAFLVYFIGLVSWSTANLWRARQRSLTPTGRRRMSYLFGAFIPATMGAIPYLVVAYFLNDLPNTALVLFPIIGNAGIAIMAVVMAYSVAFHSVLMPDRWVKQNLIQYLLRGPFLAICVILLILLVPRFGRILGIQTDKFLVFAMIFVIIILQVLIERLKPALDLLVYQKDRDEIGWLQEIDQRLITTTDLEQLLENTLAAICETLRVRTAFIVAADGEGQEFRLRAWLGNRAGIETFLASHAVPALMALTAQRPVDEDTPEEFNLNGFLLLPLYSRVREVALGVLGVETGGRNVADREESRRLVQTLITNLEIALEDMRLQRQVFAALQQIGPEIEMVQQWGSQLRYASPLVLEQMEINPIFTPDFQRMVKDALTHYWGGPKLTNSPLLRLEIVKSALGKEYRTPAQALRAMIQQAVESLRPAGEHDPSANAWILYNILKMKFIQGKRVKETASELAMSESDFYRKERAAVEEVARILAMMEQEKLAGGKAASGQ